MLAVLGPSMSSCHAVRVVVVDASHQRLMMPLKAWRRSLYELVVVKGRLAEVVVVVGWSLGRRLAKTRRNCGWRRRAKATANSRPP